MVFDSASATSVLDFFWSSGDPDVSIRSCLILGLISSSGELEGNGDVEARRLGVEVSVSASSRSLFGVLEAPPSSKRSGGAIDGLAKGGVWILLFGSRLAVRSEGLRPLEFAVET